MLFQLSGFGDETFLAQKAEMFGSEDWSVARDLLDTPISHKAGCVGMAVNMIGVNKRIIVFDNECSYMVMFNPEIVKKSAPTRRRRAVSPLPTPGKPNAGNSSKCRIRTSGFRSASRPSPTGRPRLSSTKSATVKGC